MRLTVDEVKKIATLARLRLRPDEAAVRAEQLSHIVDYVDQLAGFETAEPAATEGVPEAADQLLPSLEREQFLANAPATAQEHADQGFLTVPKVKASTGDQSG